MGYKSKDERYCIDCNKKGIKERNRCEECAKAYNRKRARERHKKYGRYNYGQSICPICNKPMTLWSRNQASHSKCRIKVTDGVYNKNVKYGPNGQTMANYILETSGVVIPKGSVVHHIDENPNNNSIENLIVIERKVHNSLHRKLQYKKALWLKSPHLFKEKDWKEIRTNITNSTLNTGE